LENGTVTEQGSLPLRRSAHKATVINTHDKGKYILVFGGLNEEASTPLKHPDSKHMKIDLCKIDQNGQIV
jgi:hypothetical protein